MSTQQARELKAEGLTDDAVVQYLQATPDFFERHAALLLKLRLPHTRTSGQTVSLIERQVELGIVRFKCATLAEAAMAAGAGATDVLLAYPLVGPAAPAFAAVAARFPGVRFSALVDNSTGLHQLADAAASLARLTDAFPEAAPLHGLTGAAGDIAAVAGALGYRYGRDPATGEFAHLAAAAVLTADGRLAAWLYGVAPSPEDLHLALTEAGEGRLGTWKDQIRLLCYHYDPETGRYGSLAIGLLRIAGAATAGGGAFLIGLALVRERRRRP